MDVPETDHGSWWNSTGLQLVGQVGCEVLHIGLELAVGNRLPYPQLTLTVVYWKLEYRKRWVGEGVLGKGAKMRLQVQGGHWNQRSKRGAKGVQNEEEIEAD